MPDNEITGDMGTCYIVTDHQGFIEALETITDYKVMACFLDANKHYYQELVKTPSHFDKEIDVTPSVMIAVKDNDMDFMDKIIDETKITIPRIKGSAMYDNDRKMGTDYEYNHSLDELMQMRSKINSNLDQYQGKQIGKFGTIEEAFYEDTGIKVRIKDLGLIEFETDDFFQQVKQAI